MSPRDRAIRWVDAVTKHLRHFEPNDELDVVREWTRLVRRVILVVNHSSDVAKHGWHTEVHIHVTCITRGVVRYRAIGEEGCEVGVDGWVGFFGGGFGFGFGEEEGGEDGHFGITVHCIESVYGITVWDLCMGCMRRMNKYFKDYNEDSREFSWYHTGA